MTLFVWLQHGRPEIVVVIVLRIVWYFEPFDIRPEPHTARQVKRHYRLDISACVATIANAAHNASPVQLVQALDKGTATV